MSLFIYYIYLITLITADITTTTTTTTTGNEIASTSSSDNLIIRTKAELFGRGKLIEVMNLTIVE